MQQALLTKPSPPIPRHSPLLMLPSFFSSNGAPKIKVSEETGDSYCLECLGGDPKEPPHDEHDFDVSGDFILNKSEFFSFICIYFSINIMS